MRKLCWWGCAVMVVGAACMYGASRWAECHPESPTACCARVAWRVVTEWNPIVQVGRMMGAKAVALIQPKPPLAPTKLEAAPAYPADPGVTPPPPLVEVIDLGNWQTIQLPERRDNHSPEYMPASPDFPLERELASMQQGQVETVLPGAIEEAEQPVPAEMPPADADTPDAKPTDVEYWINRFRDDDEAVWKNAETLPMPRVEDADEEDVELLPEPSEDVSTSPEAVPMPSEDVYQIQLEPPSAQRYRIIINQEEEVCQTNVDSFGLYGHPCGEECEQAPELLPMPREEAAEELPAPALDEGAVEETEPSQPGPVPDCQEDPNMYQRYPGCPMTGGCPGRSGCPTGAHLGKPDTMEARPTDLRPSEVKPME